MLPNQLVIHPVLFLIGSAQVGTPEKVTPSPSKLFRETICGVPYLNAPVRSSRPWILLLLVVTTICLGGCEAVEPVPFAGSLTVFVVILLAVAAILQPLIASKSLTVGATVLITLALASLTWFWSEGLFKNLRNLKLPEDSSKLFALLLFAVASVLGGIVAMFLVQVDPSFSLYIFILTSIIVVAIVALFGDEIFGIEKLDGITWILHRLNRIDDDIDAPTVIDTLLKITLLVIAVIPIPAFALWLGSLLSLGLLYGSIVAPIIVILGGVGSICFLCYRAWSTAEMQPKIGIYTVAAILAYELWLLIKQLVSVWH